MTAPHPDSPCSETLAFVASGFVHRIGNLMFTIQGHAQLAARATATERDITPIANAAERGAQALAVMRTLLGTTSAPTADAGDLLETIGDLARIPVRETGKALVCVVPEGAGFLGVDPGSFCPAVLETVRRFARILPGGEGGRIVVTLAPGPDGGLSVRVQHEPADGSLPFPVATAQIRIELQAALRSLPRHPRISCISQGIELAFGTAERRPAALEQA